MEKARHVLRIAFALVVVVSVLLIARGFVIPASYGLYGPYRYDNVAEQRAKPVLHHGAESCKNCHEKQWLRREDGEAHLKVSCEACHGPLGLHADGTSKETNKKIGPAKVDRSYKLCALCHWKMEGRPANVKQVVFEKHLKGEKLEGKICLSCHDPHSTMPEDN